MVDTNIKFANLPGMYPSKQDGNLVPEATSAAPRVVVIGTAAKGQSTPFLVATTSGTKNEFGTDGTLYRGMMEALKGGAAEILLVRVGATPALLTGIGDDTGVGGYSIETVFKDNTAGDSYAVWFEAATDRLVISRVADSLVVFDNNLSAPIDRFEVLVSGFLPDLLGTDIGTESVPIVMSSVDPSPFPGTAFTAGTDGVDLSRMEMYEQMYVTYKDMLNYSFDVINPMDVYNDDLNTVDQGHLVGAKTPKATLSEYPTSGVVSATEVDSLGMVFVEEYQGVHYFWWRFATSGVTADIFPGATEGSESADATTKMDGTTLAEDDFHEVNFSYQLGRFLYEYSTNIVDATGNIGVLPPQSGTLTGKARWVGKAPVTETSVVTGETLIITNGYGLLGNKFMGGMSTYRSGLVGGGFIATDGEFMDSGDEVVDSNEIPVDLGKYFNIVADWPLLRNNFNQAGYIASFAASYGGFYSTLNTTSAPTNKKVSNAYIVYNINVKDIDKLAGAGYVALRTKPQGVVIADAPTAALATSDWTRLSTVRVVKDIIDGMRSKAEAYLGELLPASKKAAFENSLESVLTAGKKAGLLKDYREFSLIQTPDMEIQGKAVVLLTLVTAPELRQIELVISLSKSG